MLYVSAVFLFLFLPILLAVFSVAPIKMRRGILTAGGIAFYVLANFNSPFAIIVLTVVLIATYFVGGYIDKTRKGIVLFGLMMTDIAALFILRIIYEASEGFVFPLGAAIFMLSSVSYCYDIYRKETERGGFADLLLYMTFFPIMVAGPVVRYKDFKEHVDEAEHSISTFAEGVRVFATGFIKLVAVASVAYDGYNIINDLGGDSLGFFGAILSMIFVVVTVFFALSGWSDMGCGLSLMFGIRIPRDFDFAFISLTPSAFFGSIFKSLHLWIYDYAVSPIEKRFFRRHRKLFSAVARGLTVAFVILWIRTTAVATIAALVAGAVVFAEEYYRLDDLVRSKKIYCVAGWLVTFLLGVFIFSALISDGIVHFGESLGRMTLIPSFDIFYVYNALSGSKYIFVLIVGVIIGMLSHKRPSILQRLNTKSLFVYESANTALLMAAFVLTLLYFMPQYPEYAYGVFEHFVF